MGYAHFSTLAAVRAVAPNSALEVEEELGGELRRFEIREGIAHAQVTSAGHRQLQKVAAVTHSPNVVQEPILHILAREVLDHERGELNVGSVARAWRNVGRFAIKTWGGMCSPQRDAQR